MIDEKLGKGGKGMETYNTKNGEYVRDPRVEEDEKNFYQKTPQQRKFIDTIYDTIYNIHIKN